MYPSQLVDDKELFKTNQDLKEQFDLTVLQINSLKCVIKRPVLRKLEPTKYETIKGKTNTAGTIYHKINGSYNEMFVTYIKWQSKFQINQSYGEFLHYFTNIKKMTNYGKFRSMQYRILNMALVTRVDLFHWKIVTSDRCYFCNQEQETMAHLFYECMYAKKLLESIPNIVANYQPMDMQNPNFTLLNVLLNNVTNKPNTN